MSYITLPKTITTGTPVRASELNQNFLEITQGLAAGTKELHVNTMTASNVNAQAVTIAGDRFLVGETITQRVLFQMHYKDGARDIDQLGTGYLGPDHSASATTGKDWGLRMPRNGSVIHLMAIAEEYNVLATVGVSWELHKNGATQVAIGSIETSGGVNPVYPVTVTTNPGVYTFVAGDEYSIYQTNDLIGSTEGSVSIFMEVVFD